MFLLSRIKEARDGGMADREAVAFGVERSGRIVTAAALLFCVAVGAFATSGVVFIKQVGLGTALGVAIDATIVRALLVRREAARALERWAPRPLKRRTRAASTRAESTRRPRYRDILLDMSPRRPSDSTPTPPTSASRPTRRASSTAPPTPSARPKKDLVAGLVARYVDPDTDDGLAALRRLGAEAPGARRAAS